MRGLRKGKPERTEIRLDFGTFVHFLFGMLAAWLGSEYLFTTIFLVKQIACDLLVGGEDYAEQSGDIAEFASGLVVGLVLRHFGVW